MTTMFPTGAAVVSTAVFHAERADPDLGPQAVGGLVYDTWADTDGEMFLAVVDTWRGRIVYHTIPAADARPGYSGGLVNTRQVKLVLLAIARDSCRDPIRHLDAYVALGRVLESRSPQRSRGQ